MVPTERIIEKPVEVQVIIEKVVPQVVEVPKVIEVEKIVEKIVEKEVVIPAKEVQNHIEVRNQIVDRIV